MALIRKIGKVGNAKKRYSDLKNEKENWEKIKK